MRLSKRQRHGRNRGRAMREKKSAVGERRAVEKQSRSARNDSEARVPERASELRSEEDEQTLRQSEEHFRSLIENATDIITTVLDLDGTLRYASPAVERLLGYKPEELIGRNISEFTHPDDETATSRLRANADSQDNVPVSLELRFKHKCGEWRIIDVFGRLVRDEFGQAQVIANSRDITARKRAVDTLKESETL